MSDRRNIVIPGTPPRNLGEAALEQGTSESWLRMTKRYRKWILVVMLSILAIGTVLAFELLPPEVPVYAVTRHDLIQTVVASGHIESPYRVNIGSQITGIVAEVPVEEGQAVKAGEILIKLDDHEYASAVDQAKATVSGAEVHLRQIREVLLPSAEQTLKQAEATAVNAQSSYVRTLKLLNDGYTTIANYDVVRRDRDIAELAVRNAALQVATNRPGGSDYVMAENQLVQAKANLDTALAKEGYAKVIAPLDGRLILRNVERGDVVNPSDTLLVLTPTGEIRIDLQIDERDIGLLRLGQSAVASADAYQNHTFPAEVSYINPGVDVQQASVLVKLRVPDPPAYLVQDMTVSAEIEVGRRQGSLVLPLVAIHDVKGPAPWVLMAKEGRLVRRRITVGMLADELAEVTGGLDEGALVLPANASGLMEGDHVRPARVSVPGM